jgi:hypothetical protein
MNFSQKNSKDKGIQILSIEKKDPNFNYSNYAQLNDESTRNNSLVSGNKNPNLIVKSEVEKYQPNNKDICSDINQYYVESRHDLLSDKSKIGMVKLGYNKFCDINPISRYNFLIDRYNEEINVYHNVYLKKIPFFRIFSLIYDFYIWWVRIIFAAFIFLVSEISKKFKLKSYHTYFKFYTIISIPDENWNTENNIRFLILSLCSIAFHLFCLFKFFWVIFISVTVFFIILLYANFFVKKNNLKIRKNMYKNMIFDEKINKSKYLNDYITVNPGNVEEYSSCTYYNVLLYLYRSRDYSIPQQFMLYGNILRNEKNVVRYHIFRHLICLLFLICFYASKSVYENK